MKVHFPVSKVQGTAFSREQMISLSVRRKASQVDAEASQGGSTLESLLPVWLEDEKYQEFRRSFHPRPRVTGRTTKFPDMYIDLANYLYSLSHMLECVYEGLATLAQDYEYIRSGDVGAHISSVIENRYESANGDQVAAVHGYIRAMATGGQHILKDSQRFKGGKDVLFAGFRGSSKSAIIHASQVNQRPMPLTETALAAKSLEQFNESSVGKALVETGQLIFEAIFAERLSKSGTYRRLVVQHDLGWDPIHQLERILTKGPLARVGIVITLPTFVGGLMPDTKKFLHPYNSIISVYEPNNVLVGSKVSHDGPDESLVAFIPGAVLSPEIRFSYALNIPQDFCEFITQTKDKQIPLTPLSIWASTWASCMMRIPNSKSGGGYPPPHRAPTYALLPSKLAEVSARRKQLGLYSEKGRCNEDNLFISGNGDLGYLPKSGDLATENAKTYEELLERSLRLSFDAGVPLNASQVGSVNPIYDLASPTYAKDIRDLKTELSAHSGSLQAFDWDSNCVISVSASEPDRIVSAKLVGASRPDALNFASYMRTSFDKAMGDMFSRATSLTTNGKFDSNHYKIVEEWANCSIFNNFAAAYTYYAGLKKVPGPSELLKKAAEALKIKSLNDESVAPFEILRSNPSQSIYKLVNPDLSLRTEDALPGSLILSMLITAAQDASGHARSNLTVYAAKNNMDLEDTGRYFNPDHGMQFHEFSTLYQYFGGQVFYQAVKALLALKDTDIQKVDMTAKTNNLRYNVYMTEVLPFCHMVGRYIIEKKEKIFHEADRLREENLHPTASEDDLNIAGSREGMVLFPHQAEALTVLKSHPRFAVLDIGAGGGKTTIGIADIAMLYADGLIKRPFIFCPNGLVRNWVDDLHKHTQGRWNVIPVTTDVYKKWGDERLTEMIKNAPPNTIVVVGNSFISNRVKVPFVVGNNVEFMSDSVEFCKKFEPDYFLIDESHRLKSTKSGIHRGIKTIAQISSVKYGRIGTGTLIQNVLSDVVGQAAIHCAQIFRTKDDFDNTNKVWIEGPTGRAEQDYDADAAVRARQRFSEFATVLSYKRKEWAFMLPLPIETFISVGFEEGGDYELGNAHRMFYDAVLKETLKELQADRSVKTLLNKVDSGDGDEDDEDDESSSKSPDANHKQATQSGGKLDVTETDDDSDNLDSLEAALQPYLQRLERLLTDPFGDEELAEVADEFFKGLDRSKFVPAKIRKIIDRIKFHYTKTPWKKGETYHPNQMVDVGNDSFILRPDAPNSGAYKSIVPPAEDVDNWKPQIRGKVMVFCRYTRTVNAIFEHLPAEFKRRAVKFHGEVEGDKWDNLQRFQSDPKIDILVANEMGISEGHNLQVASRFIRAEAPWAPGELDQSAARVFRPDVREDGKVLRSSIFLDWVICDGTLEVAKMGRLISKMLRKTQFDEANNTQYYKNLNPLNLPIIRMTLDNIRVLNRMSDLCSIGGDGDVDEIHPNSYIGQYQYLVGETASEFHEMRRTKRSTMIRVEPTPMPGSAKVIEYTPWVANQTVPDRNGEGLVSLTKLLQTEDPLAEEFKTNKHVLLGKIVRTEFGIGKITRINLKRKGAPTEGEEDEDSNEINSLNIELSQGGIEKLKASGVYLATKVTERDMKRAGRNAPKITDADKKRTGRYDKEGEEDIERAHRRDERIRREAKKDAGTGRPVKPRREPAQEPEGIALELYAVVYNQFLAVEAIGPEGVDLGKVLKPYDFKSFGDYAFIPVPNYKTFSSILDWLDSKFTLSSKTERLLEKLHDNFQTGRGRKFAVELSAPAELPLFYRQMHRRQDVTNPKRPELRVYPVILDGSLMLVVDIATNPVILKHLNKTIPGATVKFTEVDGLAAAFFQRKTELVALYRQLRADGFNITNLTQFKEEIKNLLLTQTKL